MYLPNWKTFAIASITTIYVFIGIRIEEGKLIKEYGQDYVDYQQKVPMLIPFLK